jgi:hypothetical protein
MAQFIRTLIDIDNIQRVLQNIVQISQVSYRDQRIIEINWDNETRCVVVHDNDLWLYLSSPDIERLTINQVLNGIGYENEQAVVTWASDDRVNSVLNSFVDVASLNQITLYGPNQPIPNANAEPEPDFGAFQSASQPADDDNHINHYYCSYHN